MADFLLKNANPSIKLRVKKEILNNLTKEEAEMYQEQIMNEPLIQKIMACKKENGWIGKGLHGGIQLSIDSFKHVLEVDSVLDITRPVRKGKKLVFKDYEKWPCRYHLDILAHTTSWKILKVT